MKKCHHHNLFLSVKFKSQKRGSDTIRTATVSPPPQGHLSWSGRNQPQADWQLWHQVVAHHCVKWECDGKRESEKGRMVYVLWRRAALKSQERWGMGWCGWIACHQSLRLCLGLVYCHRPCLGLWSWCSVVGCLCPWLMLPLRSLRMPEFWAINYDHISVQGMCPTGAIPNLDICATASDHGDIWVWTAAEDHIWVHCVAVTRLCDDVRVVSCLWMLCKES